MSDFSKLPLIISEQFLSYVLSRARMNINKKLTLLGVCHDWRQIAMSQLYRTMRIAEPTAYAPVRANTWNLLGPSECRWCLNVAPFNISNVFRHAKKLEIAVCSESCLDDLYSMLEYIFSFDSSRQSAISELDIWFSEALTPNPSSLRHNFQRIADFLLDAIPTLVSFCLRVFDCPTLVGRGFIPILTKYSGPSLHILKTSSLIDFSHPIDFRNLTVLELGLSNHYYHILSFLEPRILRKLHVPESRAVYIWKYFVSDGRNNSQLVFENLTELGIGPDYSINSADKPGVGDSFMSEHIFLSKKWAHAIASRRIFFPSLESLDFEGYHFIDLLLAACEFPKEIAKVTICYHEIDSLSSCKWILDNAPTRNISLIISPFTNNESGKWIHRFIDPQSSYKIFGIYIRSLFEVDAAQIFLPGLTTLYIFDAYFSKMLSLISKLPMLKQLTIKCLNFPSNPKNRCYSTRKALATPICPSLFKITIKCIHTLHCNAEGTTTCIKNLLSALTGLRLAVFNMEQGSQFVLHVAKNDVKYPHFKKLAVTLVHSFS